MQCGADSISYDKLGDFCLTVRGHGECVRYVKSFGLPMLLLGGGGYTIENVLRCWTYETGVILNEDLPNEMPITDYYTKYGPEYKLHNKPANHPNINERKFLLLSVHALINKKFSAMVFTISSECARLGIEKQKIKFRKGIFSL